MSSAPGVFGGPGSYHCGKADWSKQLAEERAVAELSAQASGNEPVLPKVSNETKQQVVAEEQTQSSKE